MSGPVAQTGLHELTREQQTTFYEISNRWRRTVFPLCLKQNRLKLSCADCASVYIAIVLNIGPDGKLKRYEKKSSHVCGGKSTEKLERCFIEYFESITFPDILRNMIIDTSLGNGLKC